jgi:hypothetical protein
MLKEQCFQVLFIIKMVGIVYMALHLSMALEMI